MEQYNGHTIVDPEVLLVELKACAASARRSLRVMAKPWGEISLPDQRSHHGRASAGWGALVSCSR